ncbi:MAG TPA: hypothetical protein VNB94_02135 [Mycobacteriales bacterium]|nr:hypothetical protein [Mycobacteriales bacterium]
MRRLAPTAVLLGLAVVAIASAQGAGAAGAPATTSHTGTYQRVAAHAPGDGHAHAHAAGEQSGVRDMLIVGKRAVRLTLPKGRTLKPGATVRVRGTMTGSTLMAIDATTTTEPTAIASAGGAATKTSVLVILAAWTGPDSLTPEAAAAQLFSDGDEWRTEVSNGSQGFTGSVTPWLTITGPTGGLCFTNHKETMLQAKAAALTAGFDPTTYQRVVLYHPKSSNPDCSSYGGWAYQPGAEVWMNGVMSRRTLMHELGHNDGLRHAGSLSCSVDGVFMTLAANGCSLAEYGDITDAMGNATYVGHFSVVQKARLGWLGARSVALQPGGSAILAPVETAGTDVIAASIDASNGRRYWLESRSAAGADALLPAGVLGGVLIRIDDPSLSPAPLLLDLTPDGSMANAALPVGGSWSSPEGLRISTALAPDGRVAVTVSTDTVAPAAPSAVSVAIKGTSATVKWVNPTDIDFASVVVQMKAGTVPPASAADGTRIYAGSGMTATTSSLVRGVTYSFAVFARDQVPNWSAGATPAPRTRK